MKPKTVALLVILALLVITLLLNMEPTRIRLLFWYIEMPLFVLILTTLAIGWIFGWFTHVAYRRGKNRGTETTSKVKGKAEPQVGEQPGSRP